MPTARPSALPDEVGAVLERGGEVVDRPTLKLKAVHARDTFPEVALSPGRYLVGSDPTSDIRITASGVHPRHCLLVAGPVRTALRALAAPTRVNGRPVEEAVIVAGDRLTIGPVELRAVPAREDDATPDADPVTDLGPRDLDDIERGVISPAAERLLNELQDRLSAAEYDERVKRFQEDYLRRENDAVLATAAAADAARRLITGREELRIERSALAAGGADLHHRRRLLTELTEIIVATQRDLVRREESFHEQAALLGDRLTASTIAETEHRKAVDELANRRAAIDEEQSRLEHQSRELARRITEADERDEIQSRQQRQIDQRLAEIEQLSSELTSRESVLASDRESLAHERQELAAERDRLHREREAILATQQQLASERSAFAPERATFEKEREEIESARRRLETEREQLASAAAANDSARLALEAERTELAERLASVERGWAELAQEQDDFERWVSEAQERIAADRAAVAEREAAVVAAESDIAWQQRSLEDEFRRVEWLQAELIDRQREFAQQELSLRSWNAGSLELCDLGETNGLDADVRRRLSEEQARLSVVASALAAERAALRDEEARFVTARRAFAAERQRHEQEVTRLEQSRRQVEAARDGLIAVLQGGPPAAGQEAAAAAALMDIHGSTKPETLPPAAKTTNDNAATDAAPSEPVAVVDTAPGYWTPQEAPQFSARIRPIELDDAHNPESVAKYMEELLTRIREDNPLVPPPPEPKSSTAAKPADTNLSSNAASVPEPPRPVVKKPLDKAELRAQTTSLRAVANRHARGDIARHTLRRKKAQLAVKAVLVAFSTGLAASLFVVSFRSDGAYLWQTAAAYVAALVVFYDFLNTVASLRRQVEQAKLQPRRRVARRKSAQPAKPSQPGTPATSESPAGPSDATAT